MINALRAAAAQANVRRGERNHFADAAAVFERTGRDVQFVSPRTWRQNRDGNPKTFALVQVRGGAGPVQINARLGRGDLIAAAAHAALTHAENQDGAGLHFGDGMQATLDRDQEIWDQLPARLRPSAELWRRRVELQATRRGF